MTDNKVVIILSGIPTSGKSTWAKQFKKVYPHFKIVSRDTVREKMYGHYKNIPFTKASEMIVSVNYDNEVRKRIKECCSLILDNTHCRDKYIREEVEKFEALGYTVFVNFFDISLRKAFYRNIVRYLLTGKWIPIKAIRDMKKNYDKLNKLSYNYYERNNH